MMSPMDVYWVVRARELSDLLDLVRLAADEIRATEPASRLADALIGARAAVESDVLCTA